MAETIRPDGTSTVPWLTSDPRMPVPDTSMLPDSERAPSTARGLLKNAVQAETDALRHQRDAWVESVRTTVRSNPLAAVAGALALGAVIARLLR